MDRTIKDFVATIRVKNNQLVARREQLGMTQAEVAALAGVSKGTYEGYENLRESPIHGKYAGFKNSAKKIADILAVKPETLWSEAVLAVEQNTFTKEFDAEDIPMLMGSHAEMAALPAHEKYDRKELAQQMDLAMGELTDRERLVLNLRFGLQDGIEHLSSEVADLLGVSRSRAQQIEAKALRKIRTGRNRTHLEVFQ